MADSPRDSTLRAAVFAGGNERRAAPSNPEIRVVKLFDQLRGGLLRYILHFGLPVADGEEIVQETFLALFRHLRHRKPDDNLRAWVFRVAHNLALKRRAATRCDADINDLLFADPSPNPEDQAANQQRRTRLLAVLQALPEQDRRCLYLRAEGLRYREIAGALGMSLGAVSLSLGRSLARLGRVDARL